MASSGTKVRWAGPGPGKGPQRRHWAWAEEEKDRDRSSMRGWPGERPFPGAASPELLEDFCLAQQHPPPLEWDPDLQGPAGSSEEEHMDSPEEVNSPEDVDSPEGSPLPLSWPPRQDHQSDMTEEEIDVAPASPEVEEAGDSSPRLGCKASPSSEDNENTSPMALGWGQANGNRPLEHSEVNPSVELSLARSWSSGTVSLGHPSDSLDSTWEGETDVPPPTALAETLPEGPSHHLLHPDDRIGHSVAQATPMEFQGTSAPPAWGPQCTAGGWRTDPTSLPSSQLKDQAWKRTKTSPKPLPSRFTGSRSPLNPRPKLAQKHRLQPSQGATLASCSSSDAPMYGRGRLNYPLPDFSKVGPRVRFPKDESYRPPKSKSHSRQPQASDGPLIFKSPAEIVREVLLSSGEVSPAKDPPPAHPVTRVPQEFQTPEQATELVHQLQEDYHRLLTKYAEAENTIDQLRLGAKVTLYSDLPQPSRNIHEGTVPQGTKVLSFTIPQPRLVEWRPGPVTEPRAAEPTGWPAAQGELSPSSHPDMPTPGWLPESQGIAPLQPSTEGTQVLASQASRLLAQVESFEGLMEAGQLTPQERLKGFLWPRAAHAALEEEYLRARRGPPPTPQLADSQGTPGTFDPGRELEAEIHHLGIRLEKLKDHEDQTQGQSEPSWAAVALDSTLGTLFPHPPAPLPAPPGQASVPATPTPRLEAQPTPGPCPLHMDGEGSPGSSETELSQRDLPALLRHKELQTEQDFQGLLERYLSMKSLPEALRVKGDKEQLGEQEEEEEEEKGLHTPGVNGPASLAGKAEATRFPPRQHPARAEQGPRAPPQENVEQMVSRKPPGSQTSKARDRHLPGLGKTEAAALGPGTPPNPVGTKAAASHLSSLSSPEGSGLSEHLAPKTLHQVGAPEDPWMASPETDSGFMGSETSRVSPLTQTPEHRLSHSSTPGTLAHHVAASVPLSGDSHPKARGPRVPRREAGPSTSRNRALRHLLSTSGTPRHRTPGSHLEQAVAMGVPGSELQGQKRTPAQVLPSRTTSPMPTPSPEAAPPPSGPAETIPNLLLTRTERDQAIRELQAEVSRLRLRLEDSLQQPPQGSPKRAASASDRPARTRDRAAHSSWGSHGSSKSTERLSGEPEGSESEPPSPQLPSGKITEDSPRAAHDGTGGTRGTRRPDRVSFQGQYTGQEYHMLSPKAILRGSGSAFCAHCQSVKIQDTGAAASDPLRLLDTDSLRCPLCGQAGASPEEDGPSPATSGADKAATRRDAPPTSSPRQRSKRAGSPPRPPPGLWYLAAAPSAPAPPAFAYISSVPIMPYPAASVYYAPPASTSAPKASLRPSRRHQHSIQLDLDDLEELHRALSRAVQAAESVRSTTQQMRHSLSADLRQAHDLRGSCLF
ncbi:AT-hook-containing transcription factor [Fukomys damarensis]|uniref:AT-hook-containing transcription factor n=1 Tax=Fukomys damarensis TaxID=885580 RepID=A0A091D957_FUKDA|nr:AT-hook-containing transcription factor [Fukomys damarensis]